MKVVHNNTLRVKQLSNVCVDPDKYAGLVIANENAIK